MPYNTLYMHVCIESLNVICLWQYWPYAMQHILNYSKIKIT